MTRATKAALAIPAAGVSKTGVGLVFGSVLLLFSAWPLAKMAVTAGASPLWLAEDRAILSGIVATLLFAITGGLKRPAQQDIPATLAIGGLQPGAFFALVHEAVAWILNGRTAILANTTTMWLVPLSLIFLRERISAERWIAADLGPAGIAELINPLAIDWSSPPVLIGHLFLLGAGLSWGTAIIVTRARQPRPSMFALLPWCFLIASIMLLPLVALRSPAGNLGHTAAAWGALTYIDLIAGPWAPGA